MKRRVMTGIVVLIAAALGACSSPLEGSDVKLSAPSAPSAPGQPSLSVDMAGFHVSWNAVEFAQSYRVYYGTAPTPPAEAVYSGPDTQADIDDFANGIPCYVWVRAENKWGLSPFSEAASITPYLPEPGEPVLTAGDGAITVAWIPVAFAVSYNIYYAASATRPETPQIPCITETTAVITGLVNDTTYYVWVETVNASGTSMSEARSMTLTLPAPAPVLTAGNGQITVQWEAVALAASYNVYYAASEACPETPAHTGLTETTAVITGLVNNTPYSVWVEAVNAGGRSMSEAKSMTLTLPAPGNLVLTKDYGSMTVTWSASAQAASYNVYYSANATPPGTPAHTGLTGTSAVITGLANNTPYYVWVEAVNAGGRSMSAPVSGMPYQWWEVASAATFTAAISAINASAQSNRYLIILKADIATSNIVFTDNGVAKTITLRGEATLRTLSNNGSGAFFTVNANNTLVLDNNVKLDGNQKAYRAVGVDGGTLVIKAGSVINNAKTNAVSVSSGAFTMEGGEISGNTASSSGGVSVSGGTFTMTSGEISGNTVSGGGGGVSVYGGGAFTMTGGKINGNTASEPYSSTSGGGVYVGSGTFTMEGGEISGNTASSGSSSSYGGGVYVSGTFTMTGGEISGNISSRGDGVYISMNGGTFTMAGGEISGNRGSGVYVSGGTFTMTSGKINGNTASDGSGVYVSGGTFTMTGGEISGNTGSSDGGGVYVSSGTFTMEGGEISGNTALFYGGGVYVSSGTFTMTGGKISGNTARAGNGGGVCVYDYDGTFTKNGGGTIDATNSATKGKVAYVYSSSKRRNTTAGPSVNLDSRVSGSAGGWE